MLGYLLVGSWDKRKHRGLAEGGCWKLITEGSPPSNEVQGTTYCTCWKQVTEDSPNSRSIKHIEHHHRTTTRR
ncbi:hypothetical protein BDE02_04G203400 [Populus trichocarpa]|nr:hypothetical protein BDE02_04G203400 [Populus trichocarpa]KAI5593215.1 hypothetical protein BDE02_04G203400 [Populus trichocarpa]